MPCCADFDRPAHYERVLHRQKAPSLSVPDRDATCELWPPTRSRNSCGTQASATALAVFRDVAKHASSPRARRAALVVTGPHTRSGTSPARGLSSSVQDPVVRRASCGLQVQPVFAWRACKRHCGGCLSGGGETREPAARARRAALTVIGLHTMKEYCAGKKPPLFRLKIVLRRASCGLKHAAGIRVAHTHAQLLLPSLGRWRNTQACRTRAVPR